MMWIILAAGFVYTIIMVAIYWRFQKKMNQLKNSVNNNYELIGQLENEKQTLLNADLRFNQQLKEVQAQILSLDKQIQSNHNVRDNDGGYQHALKILSMGGSKEEIMESCHLSNAEAELLMNLNAYRSALTK